MLDHETANARTAGLTLLTDDPARRPHVLFRGRPAPGSQVSAWWMIGAFALASATVVVAAIAWLPAEL